MSSASLALPDLISAKIYIYMGIPIVIFGVIGGILNIIVFLSLRIFRESSCGIYLIMISLVNTSALIFGFLNRVLVNGFQAEIISNSVFTCNVRTYIVYISGFISLSYICLALIDQYMATSKYLRLQQWSHTKIAYRLCVIISLFWILVCIPHLIYFNVVNLPGTNKTVCIITNSIYQNYMSRFQTPILLNALPSIIMLIFGLLAYQNVKQLSYRTVPLVRRQHEIQITKMVLVQAFISVLVITPYLILFTVTNNIQFSNDPIILAHIEVVITVTLCLNATYFLIPFYIYICVSKRYRQQFFYVIFKIHFQRWCREENPNNRVATQSE